MSVSLHDLDRRVDALPATHFDAADLMRQGEARLRRRRIAAVAAVTAVVVAVVGGAVLVGPGSRNASDVPPADQKNTTPDDTNRGHDQVTTRLAQRRLTYAVGSTIHWGETTIDVARQVNTWGRRGDGKLVEYVDATDDGAVFVVGGAPYGNFEELTIPVGASAVWFTDGSAPVRIGTTYGDQPRGFEIAPTAEGSTLAWADPGSKTQPGQVVVYDTARMSEVARFGNPDAEPLAVYPDVVYWSPTGTNCDAYPGGSWGRAECQGTGPVMRFDTTSGQQSRVSRADYLADRRSRPGLLIGQHDHGPGSMFDGFERRGDRLVADVEGEAPTLALTGQPLRLRLPAGNQNPDGLLLTQWLDPDRVVLVGTDSLDGNDLVVCRLSTGSCRVAVRIADSNPYFAAPGPAISHG